MASAAHRLSFTAVRYMHRKVPKRRITFISPQQRFYRATAIVRAPRRRQDEGTEAAEPPAGSEREPFSFNIEELSSEERLAYENLSAQEQAAAREEMAELHEHMTQPSFVSEMNAEVSLAANETMEAMPHMPPPPKLMLSEQGFLAMDEDEPDDMGADPAFEGDDMTSMAHGDLEQHREMRQYARLAVWEMPLLYKHAKAFVPPADNEILRFRQTTYLGESHPAAKKIVCEFCTRDVARVAKLTEAQRIKLVKLVGVRYNPDTDIVKMSSEMHETPMQNKQYLFDLINTLIKEAKDSSDTFEDIPLDFRHHKPKRVVVFPQEWKLDAGRRDRLLARRETVKALEEAKTFKKEVVEGKSILEQAIAAIPKDVPRIAVDTKQRKRLR